MVNILIFFSLICALRAAPASAGLPVAHQSLGLSQADSLTLLTKEWVLRDRLQKVEDEWDRMKPLEPLRLELYPNHTYRLTRVNDVPNAVHGIEIVEWGNWEINKARGLISMQVTNVDGCSILSAMLYRWQIEKLTPQQLILNQFSVGEQLLVFERAN